MEESILPRVLLFLIFFSFSTLHPDSPLQAPLATNSFFEKIDDQTWDFLLLFLISNEIWGLESSLSTQKSRICSASSSLVRRVLLGLNPSAFSVCREFPPGSRRLPHQPSSGSAGWNSGSRSFCQLALRLSARFYASELSMPIWKLTELFDELRNL
ncbi:hypothetical protein SLEP1_g39432 [Rubroshorea leprosula]|uniref:Uncharacterized protein n=1 Tax=Rubroshorea leprosula TaxID=152421 RepID=A0AAV5L077_9ROSI|nr:hypothetical protein SLEP1_g39432 [Rubroshorea leprosula]